MDEETKSSTEPIKTTGRDLKLREIRKLIEALPDPGTMPYEHNQVIKHILYLLTLI